MIEEAEVILKSVEEHHKRFLFRLDWFHNKEIIRLVNLSEISIFNLFLTLNGALVLTERRRVCFLHVYTFIYVDLSNIVGNTVVHLDIIFLILLHKFSLSLVKSRSPPFSGVPGYVFTLDLVLNDWIRFNFQFTYFVLRLVFDFFCLTIVV